MLTFSVPHTYLVLSTQFVNAPLVLTYVHAVADLAEYVGTINCNCSNQKYVSIHVFCKIIVPQCELRSFSPL